MYWANLLHIYQPPDQKKFIIDNVVNQSYRPLIGILKKYPDAKISLNIIACLTERLVRMGFNDVIDDFKELAQRGQIEFTGSSAHHAFLPLLPPSEIRRQIKLNYQINRKYFGKVYPAPSTGAGFFSPEGGYSRELAAIVKNLGYQWILADEVAFTGNIRSYVYRFQALPGFSERGVGAEVKTRDFYLLKENPKPEELVSYDRLHQIRDLGLFVFFRERILSDALGSGQIMSGRVLLDCLGDEVKKNRFFFTATDGEAYGHHHPGMEKLLEDIFAAKLLKTVRVSQLLSLFKKKVQEVEPLASTWATSGKEITAGFHYSRWKHPQNKIHRLQWQLTRLAIKTVRQHPQSQHPRRQLDEALYSCQYWWASANPWWSIELIERGARRLADVVAVSYGLKNIRAVENAVQEIKPPVHRARRLYEKIVFEAFDWLRDELVWDLSHLHK